MRVFPSAETFVSHTSTEEYAVYCSTKKFHILAILFRRYHQFLSPIAYGSKKKRTLIAFLT